MKQAKECFEIFFLSANQSTCSKFVRGLTEMEEFDERFSEATRQFPVFYAKGYKDFKVGNRKSQAWKKLLPQ